MTTYAGGCACGAVRYETDAEPMMSVQCQCRDCQRASGGGHANALAFPKAAVKFSGEMRFHAVRGASGQPVRRGFCPNCGSPLVGMPDIAPEMVGILAGSLDDPSRFKPQCVMWTSSGQGWDALDPTLPKFPTMPPRP